PKTSSAKIGQYRSKGEDKDSSVKKTGYLDRLSKLSPRWPCSLSVFSVWCRKSQGLIDNCCRTLGERGCCRTLGERGPDQAWYRRGIKRYAAATASASTSTRTLRPSKSRRIVTRSRSVMPS